MPRAVTATAFPTAILEYRCASSRAINTPATELQPKAPSDGTPVERVKVSRIVKS